MKIGPDDLWVKLTDAPREFPALQYLTLYRAAVDGKIKAEQRGSAWWLWRPDVEWMAAKTVALRDGVPPRLFDEMEAAHASLSETARGICMALIQAEVGFRSLEADRLEAVMKDNPALADAIRDMINTLRAARFRWNGTAWEIEAPGITVTSRPVEPAKAEA